MAILGFPISSSPVSGQGHPIVKKSPIMLSTALSRAILGLSLVLSASSAWAAEHAPRTLSVPVVGLRYEIATLHFDPLPIEIRGKCATMADNENMRGVFWIYASARQGTRSYYVVGGYGIRAHPEAPDFPRYETLDLGTVFQIDADGCVVLGDALEVFEARYFAETPQPVLQQLADDLALRLRDAVGGPDKLRAVLRRQHLDPATVSPELRAAFKAAMQR